MRGFARGLTLQLALLLALLATALLHTSATRATAQQPDAAALLRDARATLDVGRNDEAASLFLDLLTTTEPQFRAEAWSGLIRSRAASRRNGEAATLATALLRHRAPTLAGDGASDAERASYLLGRSSFDAGDFDTAALALRRVEAGGGALPTVARLRLAQALAAPVDGHRRDVEAVAAFRAAAADAATPDDLRLVALHESVSALLRLTRSDEALAALADIARDPAASAAEIASARWLAATSRREAGDASWQDDAAAVLATSPGAPEALPALEALIEAESPPPLLESGYVYYRSRENDRARAEYLAALDAGLAASSQASAWFFLAALAERDGDEALAIDYYTRSLEAHISFSASGLTDDALWWRGLLYEAVGRYGDASDDYRRLAVDFPVSTFAVRASLRDPFVLARGGNIDAATARLRRLTESAPSPTADRAAVWLAELAGEPLALAGLDPRSIDVLLAGSDDATNLLPARAIDEWGVESSDEQAVRLWVAETLGIRAAGTPLISDDPRLAVALALVDVGERDLARSTLLALRRDILHDPHSLIDLALVAVEAGLTDIASLAAISVLARMEPEQRLATPLAVERLTYPLAYGDVTREIATNEGVPPLLLLALVRQESAYNPLAVSFADARGLTQVIPPTGALIASSLGVPWELASLFNAETSLRFGATYLGDQLERFDGNIFAALAAYNGGPVNAERWLDDQWWPGAAGYIAAIDFTETRGYVESVIEQYAWYRYLYAGAPAPSIR